MARGDDIQPERDPDRRDDLLPPWGVNGPREWGSMVDMAIARRHREERENVHLDMEDD